MSTQSIINFKDVFSSSYVKPYSPFRTIDNSGLPTSRWLCNNLPGFIAAQLPKTMFIDGYQVYQMSYSGWSPKYNNKSMRFDISMDATNWTTVDTISDTSSMSVVNRTISPLEANYVRIVVTSGLVINPKLASVMEFRVNEANPTSNLLSNLVCSAGNLMPVFSSLTQTYNVDVPSSIDSAFLIPTSEDSDSTIKVNGQTCSSGNKSQNIKLDAGDNLVSIVVTPQVGNDMIYQVNLIRQEAQAPKLSNLEISGYPGASLDPDFNPEIFAYIAVKARPFNNNINITATLEDISANLTINGDSASSGQAKSVPIAAGKNTITIKVSLNGKETDYIVEIEK
jgi:hypothetical protein